MDSCRSGTRSVAIVELLGVSKPSVSRVMEILQGNGLVNRNENLEASLAGKGKQGCNGVHVPKRSC